MRRFLLVLFLCLPALVLGQTAVTVRGPAGSDGASAPTVYIARGHLSATTTAASGTFKFGTGSGTSGTWVEDADTGADFDASVGTWTAPSDGIYIISLVTRSGGAQQQALVYIDGVQTYQGSAYTTVGSDVTVAVNLSAATTVEFYVYNNSSGTVFEDHSATGHDTFYSIIGPL